MWDRIGDQSPYSDLDITNDRIGRWHPLNQSLYVGYKVMLAGLLMISKGDRIAMNSSVEVRYPFLDDDVINFCAAIAPEYKLHGMTEKWLLRRVAERTLPKAIANRPKTMFRSSLAKTFIGEQTLTSWIWSPLPLSSEVRQKLGEIRPATLGQAARVAGVTPAAVAVLRVHLKKRRAIA